VSRDVLPYEPPDDSPASRQRGGLDAAFMVVAGTLGVSMIIAAFILIPFIKKAGSAELVGLVGFFLLLFCAPGLFMAFRLLRSAPQHRVAAIAVLLLNVIPFGILGGAYLGLI
jgi:hypothetical protein